MPKESPRSKFSHPLVDVFKQMQPPASANPLLRAQLEQFWHAQEKILEETGVFAQRWFERRHEAVRSALEVARSASSADPADAIKSLQNIAEWQRHSAERLAADAQECLETVSRCAAFVAETEAEAVEKTVDEVATVAKKAGGSSKSEPV